MKTTVIIAHSSMVLIVAASVTVSHKMQYSARIIINKQLVKIF